MKSRAAPCGLPEAWECPPENPRAKQTFDDLPRGSGKKAARAEGRAPLSQSAPAARKLRADLNFRLVRLVRTTE